jgi:hypothetical protein
MMNGKVLECGDLSPPLASGDLSPDFFCDKFSLDGLV